ncbi:MAG TPA: molybdopterin-dependent oxidoreductase [Syntrophorhabdaceae bacterium]|nr:molybdopterin-dependent oxidoreductase [Syntrophorhabdaceae bacterium]
MAEEIKKQKDFTRRDFLKVIGISGAIASLSAFPFRNLEAQEPFGKHPQEKPLYQIKKKIPQVCARACEADCAYYVVVAHDPVTNLERAITLEGRPEDPVSYGKFCIKGLAFVDSMYDPDRLMVALKRTNPKKGTDYDPGWVAVKTDDAVNEIIQSLKKFKPEEILMCSPGDPYTNKLAKSLGVTRSDQRTECFGTHYYINCLTLTNPPNKYYSSTYTPTHHVAGYDYDNAKYQVWFGFDSLSKCGKAGMLVHWKNGKKNGCKIVVFNPLRTPLADAFATEIHSIKPGTDLAVALAMINIIIKDKLYNTKFLKDYTDAPALVDTKTKLTIKTKEGYMMAWCEIHKKIEPIDTCHKPAMEGGPYKIKVDGREYEAKPVLQYIKDTLKDYTPQWASKISEVKKEVIEKVAKEFAAAKPYSFIPTYKRDAAGPNYANSWRLRHAISVLNTLTGSIDHEGGVILLHDVKIPWLEELAKPVKPYPELPKEPVDFRNMFPITDEIYRNKDFSAPGHYGMVGWGLYKTQKTKAVFFRNPYRGLFAMIQPQMVEAALEKMELVVDWNLYLDDVGYWSDYVLPAPHQFEEGKFDIRLYYPKWPCYVGGSPVQKTPGDQIGWGSLALKIGMALAPEYWTIDGSGDPKKIVPLNMSDHALKNAGIASNMAEFMSKGALWINKKKYENYKTIKEIGYGRPNGRVRMFIDEFKNVGFEPAPTWLSRWQNPKGDYKFSILITRAPWLIHADPNFINNPILKKITEKNFMDCVWINPEAAKEIGVKEGDMVILENNPEFMEDLPRPVKAKVHITNRILRKDCVLLFHGIGHRAKNLKVAGNWGYRDGDLIPQKNPNIVKDFDPTGMGWVEDVYVSIKKL